MHSVFSATLYNIDHIYNYIYVYLYIYIYTNIYIYIYYSILPSTSIDGTCVSKILPTKVANNSIVSAESPSWMKEPFENNRTSVEGHWWLK